MKITGRFFVEGIFCKVDGVTLRVANLGPGGLFAVTASATPSLGQIVTLELQTSPENSVRVMGEVSWVNDASDPKSENLPPGFGVRFRGLPASAAAAIEDMLKHADPVIRKPRSLASDRHP